MGVARDQRQQSLEDAQDAFVGRHPEYADTAGLDELRQTEFARLDDGGHVYLDYTGGGLYAQSQLREHMRLLEAAVYGNPHSVNPTSAASTEIVERARASVLSFFRGSPEEYVAIFTPNATGALRLVGEAYPFHPGDRFLLTFDALGSLRHTDGSPAVVVYGPRSWEQRGATIAFNFLHPDGRVADERRQPRKPACCPDAHPACRSFAGEQLLQESSGDRRAR